MKISAYMILHADDDFLDDVLAIIYPRVDEIVVVDGAYEWVAEFLLDVGLSSSRSPDSTQDILQKYSAKLKYFSGAWADELHKRQFAYEQCSGDLIVRIDADELFQFDERAYEDFLTSRFSMAQLELPLMVTPLHHRTKPELTTIPMQGAFFKRKDISAAEHCSYLWLVLTAAERESLPAPDWSKRYPAAVVRAAHLSQFRTPRTSVNRARFYILQYMRSQNRIPWLSGEAVGSRPIHEILSALIGIENFNSFLYGHRIVCGFAEMETMLLAPVSFEQDIAHLLHRFYKDYKQSIAALNEPSLVRRGCVNGAPFTVDVSALKQPGFHLEFDVPLQSARAELEYLSDRQIGTVSANVLKPDVKTDGSRVHVDLAQIPQDHEVYQAFAVVYPYFDSAVPFSRIVN